MNTKESVLKLLEENRGKSISGEEIAAKLEVSRNAIWKAIEALRGDGYVVKAVRNKGYELCGSNDIISESGILPFLQQDTLCDKIYVYDTLKSTNIAAKELAISGAPHGTVVIAKEQAAGHGRYGRAFFSPPGGIYMSIVLRPQKLRLDNPTAITAFAAVAVCEVIEEATGEKPGIKWVNDVFFNNLKVCGISTEATTDFENGQISQIILGIGINVGEQNIPRELKEIVGTIPAKQTRNKLIAGVLNRILNKEKVDEKEIFAKYKAHLFMLGRRVVVVGAAEEYEAVAVDIDGQGRLIVEKENGEELALCSGEVRVKL